MRKGNKIETGASLLAITQATMIRQQMTGLVAGAAATGATFAEKLLDLGGRGIFDQLYGA